MNQNQRGERERKVKRSIKNKTMKAKEASKAENAAQRQRGWGGKRERGRERGDAGAGRRAWQAGRKTRNSWRQTEEGKLRSLVQRSSLHTRCRPGWRPAVLRARSLRRHLWKIRQDRSFPPPRTAASSPTESRWNGKQSGKEALPPSSSPTPQIIFYLQWRALWSPQPASLRHWKSEGTVIRNPAWCPPKPPLERFHLSLQQSMGSHVSAHVVNLSSSEIKFDFPTNWRETNPFLGQTKQISPVL